MNYYFCPICKGHGGTYDINPNNGDIVGTECEYCRELDNIIKPLEEENAKLKKTIINLNNKISSVSRKINKMNYDAYNDVTQEREDR